MPDPMHAASDWQAAYDRARQAVEWEMAHQRARGSVAPQSWGDWLANMVSPRSAEAEVRPYDERSAAALRVALGGPEATVSPNVASPAYQQTPQLDPFKQVLYQAIAQQAVRDPREVTLQYGMRGNPQDMANYDPREQSIVLSSGEIGHLPVQDPRVQGALGHELVHFLLGGQGTPKQAQHPLINYLLGTDMGTSRSPMHEMTARPFTAAQHPSAGLAQQPQNINLGTASQAQMPPQVAEALRRLLAGTALQHGVWQENR